MVPDEIIFKGDTVTDRHGNVATVTGALHHKHLTRLTFDLGIHANKFLCYDFNDYGNNSFYGTVYGTGDCNITGRPHSIVFDIDMTPNKGSFIEYNAASPDAITDSNFLRWVSHETPKVENNTEDYYYQYMLNGYKQGILSEQRLDGMHHAEVYECNIDYSGHLEINGYSDEYTFAVSKRNNIIYSWQYFECLDQWKIPNNETIVYYSPYNKRFADDLRGFCETNDADGVKHLYSFLANGEMHKEY